MFVSSLASVLLTLPDLCRNIALVVTPSLDEVLLKHNTLLENTVSELKEQGKHVCFIISSPRGFTDIINRIMLRYRVPVTYMHDPSESEYVLVDQLPIAARTGKVNIRRLLEHVEQISNLREQVRSNLDIVHNIVSQHLERVSSYVELIADLARRRDFSELIRLLTEVKFNIGVILEAASAFLPLREDKSKHCIHSVVGLFNEVRTCIEDIERGVLENVVAPIRADLIDLENICSRLSKSINNVIGRLRDMFNELYMSVEWSVHETINSYMKTILAKLKEYAR